MKLNQVIVAVLATSAFGIAAAQEATIYSTDIVSTKSRAEVRAEAAAALAEGRLQYGQVIVFAEPAAPTLNTRSQVMAEAREALRLGQLTFGEAG